MKELLSPESKLIQALTRIADFVFLNLIYVACCIPVVTIGAAQSAMLSAARAQFDKEKNESGYRAFFRGLRSGFRRVTVLWIAFLLVIAILVYVSSAAFYMGGTVGNAAGVMATIALAIFMALQIVLSAFHARFECSAWDLVRNSMLMFLMYPLQSMGAMLLVWAPAAVLLFDLTIFVRMTPVFLFLYYSVAFQLNARMFQGPFDEIERQFFPKPKRSADETDQVAADDRCV